jgi:hypothetical protein
METYIFENIFHPKHKFNKANYNWKLNFYILRGSVPHPVSQFDEKILGYRSKIFF